MARKKISGATRLIGLIGSPVKHSSSPVIHNASFEELGLDIAYMAFDVDAIRLQDAVRGMKAMNFLGFNVTTPCKKFIIPYLDEVSEVAKIMGAVNTVVIMGGRTYGDNCDGPGFMRNLVLNGVNIRGKKITVLGGGGAASAIITQAALDGVESIDVYNRLDEYYTKAEELIDRVKDHAECSITLRDLADTDALRASIAESSLLVNATSVGSPEVPGSLIDASYMHDDLIVADSVYIPRDTELLRIARENGNKIVDGVGMFLQQAAIGERLWTGRDMPMEYIREKFVGD